MATYMNPEPMTKFANRFANGKAENISGSNMRDILAELQMETQSCTTEHWDGKNQDGQQMFTERDFSQTTTEFVSMDTIKKQTDSIWQILGTQTKSQNHIAKYRKIICREEWQ